jgi:cell division protein ZapA (FtsZ GTPase activity inhibitor)
MAKVALKVVVAGRAYPLTVEETEKDKVEAAANEINRRVKHLQDNYAVKDMQDLLAMTALQLSTSSKGQLEVKQVAPDFSVQIGMLKELLEELK